MRTTGRRIGFAVWADPDWRQYFYLRWGKDKLSISVSLKFLRNPNGPSAALGKLKMAHSGIKIKTVGKEISVEQIILLSEIGALSKTMSDLIRAWADAWRAIGGVKALLKHSV